MDKFVTDRPNNPDMECFGFKMRTRRRYNDEKIIAQCLDDTRDDYRIPKDLKVVVDVGANIGCISLVCAKHGAKVYAYEPEKNNFDTLQYNIKVNGFENQIQSFRMGVGKPGETELYVHGKNAGATSTYLGINRGLKEENYQIVKIISINNVFQNNNIEYCDLLKLDCEGSEEDIIRDFDDELASKVGQVSVEFHDRSVIQELINILSKWYEPEHIRRHEWVFRKK